MKKLLLLFIILFTTSSFAQLGNYPRPGNGELAGGLGLNYIDGDLYYAFHFTPEIAFANFGVGLDLQLDINSKGNIRKENFNEFSDYLSIIRYVRYGVKNDPLFVKLGALDYYSLGHGSIMYNYNNSPGFDARKAGLIVDIDFGEFGFESIYSRFGEAGVVGLRGFVRPLKFTSVGDIPIIGNLEVGATFAGDFNKNAGVISGHYVRANKDFVIDTDAGSMNIIGFDLGLPIISTSMFNAELYFDFAKIVDFGSGASAGIMMSLNGLGIVNATAKFERRFNGDKYIPSYFNSFYEVERFNLDTSTVVPFLRTKARQLQASTNMSNGFFGELGINVFGVFDVIGSYERLDKYPTSGILHLGTEIAPEDVSFVVRAGYDKINIIDEKDLFNLDDRSYLFFELGYKPMPYLIVSLVYSWMFTPLRGADDTIIGYEPQKRIEPRISFVYPFNF